MRRTVAVLCLLAVLLVPTPAHASCNQGGMDQSDFAGLYVSNVEQMRVEVFPCGGLLITWDNAYGRHQADYVSLRRMEGGGLIARHAGTYSPYGLDATQNVIVKPAEPGFVQVATASLYGDFRVYRLQKIS